MDFPKLNIHLAGDHFQKFVLFCSVIVWENISKIHQPENKLKTFPFDKKKKQKKMTKISRRLFSGNMES